MYLDAVMQTDKDEKGEPIQLSYNNITLDKWYYTVNPAKYKVYMWDKSKDNSILGGTKDMKELSSGGETIGVVPSLLKEKTFFNQLNSFGTQYFDTPIVYNYPSSIELFDETNDRLYVTGKANNFMYAGNYDHLIPLEKACNISIQSVVEDREDKDIPKEDADPNEQTDIIVAPYTSQTVRIKYNSTPHAIFDLNNTVNGYKMLLPASNSEIQYKRCGNYKDEKTHSWVHRETF
jgi:hypothetical protein